MTVMAVEKKFYEMSREERLDYIRKATGISDDIEVMLRPLPYEDANRMIENAIGIMSIPMGIATNFVINGRECMIPMAIEEPSLMIGQVQVVGLGNIKHAMTKILRNKNQLLATANSNSRSLTAVDLQVRQLRDKSPNNMGNMLLVELVIDTKDAMGANAINTMCEAIAPYVAKITGGEVVLKILSNYTTQRMVRCKATFDKERLGGSQIVKRILYAYALAYSDAYRAVTHNKGIMNGIDAVALATGQDFRAIEAGAHAYAARDGTYRSLTSWRRTKEGDLAGEIELPLAVGVVGGIVNVHPTANFGHQKRKGAGNGDGCCRPCAESGCNKSAILRGDPSWSHEAACKEVQ
jgi:hydroxymethylglutaryl-CoA reductase